MGSHALIGTDLHPAARERVESYLAAVVARLPEPVRHRNDTLLAELADGLLDAVAAHQAAGRRPVEAAEAAVAEFGDATALAEAFTPELAAVHARRVALVLVRTGPLVGALWAAALLLSPTAAGRLVVGPPWRSGRTGVWAAFPLLAVVVAAFVVTALLVLASTGRPSRWLPARPRLAPTAAATATGICVACDLTVFAIVAGQALAAPRSLAWAPVCVAAAASLTRLALAGRAGRRCLALRAALA